MFEANINGVRVRSDKSCSSIINGRVHFADGSWCDVDTGEVVARGGGFIQLGESTVTSDDRTGAASEDAATQTTHSYVASALSLMRLSADVAVEPYSGRDIEVTLSGSASELEAIKVEVQGELLVIEDTSRTRRRFGSFVSFGEASAEVQVKLPVGAAISVQNGSGDITIGDTLGSLNVVVQESGDVWAGRVADVTLSVQGSGDIGVLSAEGDANLSVRGSGSGDITLKGGTIDRLVASIHGSGDIEVRGVVREADLTVQGSGDLNVSRVLSKPRKRNSGSGDINVRKVG